MARRRSEPLEDAVGDRLASALQNGLEVKEAFHGQLRAGPVFRNAHDDTEWEEAGWRLLVRLGLPRLTRNVGGWNECAELRADGAAFELVGGVVQQPRDIEQLRVRHGLPVRLRDRARDEMVVEIGADDRRVRGQVRVVLETASSELQRLGSDEHHGLVHRRRIVGRDLRRARILKNTRVRRRLNAEVSAVRRLRALFNDHRIGARR